MKTIKITKADETRGRADWTAFKKSYAGKKRQFGKDSSFGMLAEVVIDRVFSALERTNGIAFDFTMSDVESTDAPRAHPGADTLKVHNYSRKNIELKTSPRNVDPKPSYSAKVPESYLKHANDSGTTHMLFASVNKKTMVLTICGIIAIADFWRLAHFYAEGEIPPGDDKPRLCNTYQIEYRQLEEFKI